MEKSYWFNIYKNVITDEAIDNAFAIHKNMGFSDDSRLVDGETAAFEFETHAEAEKFALDAFGIEFQTVE